MPPQKTQTISYCHHLFVCKWSCSSSAQISSDLWFQWNEILTCAQWKINYFCIDRHDSSVQYEFCLNEVHVLIYFLSSVVAVEGHLGTLIFSPKALLQHLFWVFFLRDVNGFWNKNKDSCLTYCQNVINSLSKKKTYHAFLFIVPITVCIIEMLLTFHFAAQHCLKLKFFY